MVVTIVYDIEDGGEWVREKLVVIVGWIWSVLGELAVDGVKEGCGFWWRYPVDP